MEQNLQIAVAMTCIYAFIFLGLAISIMAISLVFILNTEKISQIRPLIRRSFFGVFLLLCLTNVPFDVFFQVVFERLGEESIQGLPSNAQVHPFFKIASIAAQTGLVSHILFAVLFCIACWAIESKARKK